jgi:hypothetical protein
MTRTTIQYMIPSFICYNLFCGAVYTVRCTHVYTFKYFELSTGTVELWWIRNFAIRNFALRNFAIRNFATDFCEIKKKISPNERKLQKRIKVRK